MKKITITYITTSALLLVVAATAYAEKSCPPGSHVVNGPCHYEPGQGLICSTFCENDGGDRTGWATDEEVDVQATTSVQTQIDIDTDMNINAKVDLDSDTEAATTEDAEKPSSQEPPPSLWNSVVNQIVLWFKITLGI